MHRPLVIGEHVELDTVKIQDAEAVIQHEPQSFRSVPFPLISVIIDSDSNIRVPVPSRKRTGAILSISFSCGSMLLPDRSER